MKILIIVPAYNEELNIVNTVKDICENAPGIDYIVINDGSHDNTCTVLKEHKIKHMNMPVNLGLTEVVRTGFEYALKHGYDAAIQFDGDGQHDATYVFDMIQCFENRDADIVIGSRYVNEKKSFSLRGFGSNLISKCIWLTTKQKICDPTSGLRLFSKEVMKRFVNNMHYSPEPDTIALLINRGIRVKEIPVTMRERVHGTSYLSTANAIRYMCSTVLSILVLQWLCE